MREAVRRDTCQTVAFSWASRSIAVLLVLTGRGKKEWYWLTYVLSYFMCNSEVEHTRPSHFDGLIYSDGFVLREACYDAKLGHLPGKDTPA